MERIMMSFGAVAMFAVMVGCQDAPEDANVGSSDDWGHAEWADDDTSGPVYDPLCNLPEMRWGTTIYMTKEVAEEGITDASGGWSEVPFYYPDGLTVMLEVIDLIDDGIVNVAIGYSGTVYATSAIPEWFLSEDAEVPLNSGIALSISHLVADDGSEPWGGMTFSLSEEGLKNGAYWTVCPDADCGGIDAVEIDSSNLSDPDERWYIDATKPMSGEIEMVTSWVGWDSGSIEWGDFWLNPSDEQQEQYGVTEPIAFTAHYGVDSWTDPTYMGWEEGGWICL